MKSAILDEKYAFIEPREFYFVYKNDRQLQKVILNIPLNQAFAFSVLIMLTPSFAFYQSSFIGHTTCIAVIVDLIHPRSLSTTLKRKNL